MCLREGEVICWNAAPSVDVRAMAASGRKRCRRFCSLLDQALDPLETIYRRLCLCAFDVSRSFCGCFRIRVKLVAELVGFSEDD